MSRFKSRVKRWISNAVTSVNGKSGDVVGLQEEPIEGAFVNGDKAALDTAVEHASNTSNPHSITAEQVGLPTAAADITAIKARDWKVINTNSLASSDVAGNWPKARVCVMQVSPYAFGQPDGITLGYPSNDGVVYVDLRHTSIYDSPFGGSCRREFVNWVTNTRHEQYCTSGLWGAWVLIS